MLQFNRTFLSLQDSSKKTRVHFASSVLYIQSSPVHHGNVYRSYLSSVKLTFREDVQKVFSFPVDAVLSPKGMVVKTG